MNSQNLKEVEKCEIKFRIVRRNSHYNKYIKWFYESFREDGSLLSSSGYKTEREARGRVDIDGRVVSIGGRKVLHTYKELTP